MNRYDIAKNIPVVEVPKTSEDMARKCELWKDAEDGIQGTTCTLKSLNVSRDEKSYGQPYHIKITARIPCDFHVPFRQSMLMKLDGQEFGIYVMEVQQDYINPEKDVVLSGTLSLRQNPPRPSTKELRTQAFEKLVKKYITKIN